MIFYEFKSSGYLNEFIYVVLFGENLRKKIKIKNKLEPEFSS